MPTTNKNTCRRCDTPIDGPGTLCSYCKSPSPEAGDMSRADGLGTPPPVSYRRMTEPHVRPGLVGTLYERHRDDYTDLRVYAVLEGPVTIGFVVGHKLAGKNGWEAITNGHEVKSGFGTRRTAAAWLQRVPG